MEEIKKQMASPETEIADVEMEENKSIDVSEIDVEMQSEEAADVVLFIKQEFIEELLGKVFSCLD